MDSQSKQCGSCQKNLPLSEFYQIRSSDESNVRWEKDCKGCKRARRKHKSQEIHPPPTMQSAASVPSVRIRDDGEVIYKEYVYPNGEILQLTREEFDRVVEVFRMLDEQDRRINGPPTP